MQSPTLFVKIIVVSVFILLVAGFVAYRSGTFDAFTPAKEKLARAAENTATQNLPDTSRLSRIDSPPPRKTILPGSKSIIMSDSWFDSAIRKTRLNAGTLKIPPNTEPGSTLPAYIITDSGLTKTRPFAKGSLGDSITTRKYRESSTILPGSKSGPLIRPGWKLDTIRKQ
jgi:hypothetical protein